MSDISRADAGGLKRGLAGRRTTGGLPLISANFQITNGVRS
jgi:hypothetical protein